MDTSRGPPPAPTAPDPADCCGEGCNNCVFDQHDAAMQRWRLRAAAWVMGQPASTEAGTGPAESTRDVAGVRED